MPCTFGSAKLRMPGPITGQTYGFECFVKLRFSGFCDWWSSEKPIDTISKNRDVLIHRVQP